MISMASHKAKIRAEMSGKTLEAYDKIFSDVPDADPEAAKTAATIIAKIEELRAKRREYDRERESLSARQRKIKKDYMAAHPDVMGEDKIKIGFLFYSSAEPEILFELAPQELLAMPAVSGGAY